ncbi:MAG: FecCD family ABC transporter permease [Parvularculaceae bacterium]
MTRARRTPADARLNGGLAGTALAAVLAACLIGSTPLSPARVLAALAGVGAPGDETVVWAIRLPRAVAAFLVGAALGVGGAALQGLLRNPLAGPGVLGVSACASLAAAASIYFGLASLSALALPLAAVVGALGATALIAVAAARVRSAVALILIGVALSSFAGALMSALLAFAPNPFSLADLVDWTLGSVANRSFVDIALAGPFILAGGAVLFATRRGLSALTLGEEAARGVGLDLDRQRVAVVLGAGLSAGGAVALAGAVGFVGVVAPHIVRPFVGHDPARSLAPSALLAGLALVIADIVVRVLPTGGELKLGVAAALVGAPIFARIAWRRARHD